MQSITFRLADSLPEETLQRWQQELDVIVAESERSKLLRRRIDAWLDQGHGACWLRDVRVAALVQESLLHFDGERYHLLAWCIMPNHVHVMIEMVAAHDLAQIVHSWKSFTSTKANSVLEREGDFWQRDYFDRFMRDGEHFDRTRAYIEHNPVAAGLVREKAQWQWSSARGDA